MAIGYRLFRAFDDSPRMIEFSIHLETELCSRKRPNDPVQRKYNLSEEILTNSMIDTQLAEFLSQSHFILFRTLIKQFHFHVK